MKGTAQLFIAELVLILRLWAIYGKNDFESLMDKIRVSVDELVRLFPALHPQQERLCQEEVKAMDNETVSTLIEVNGNHDKLLNLAIAEVIKTQGHVFQNVVIDSDGVSIIGDNYDNVSYRPQGMRVDGLLIRGGGFAHVGHNVRSTAPRNC